MVWHTLTLLQVYLGRSVYLLWMQQTMRMWWIFLTFCLNCIWPGGWTLMEARVCCRVCSTKPNRRPETEAVTAMSYPQPTSIAFPSRQGHLNHSWYLICFYMTSSGEWDGEIVIWISVFGVCNSSYLSCVMWYVVPVPYWPGTFESPHWEGCMN